MVCVCAGPGITLLDRAAVFAEAVEAIAMDELSCAKHSVTH